MLDGSLAEVEMAVGEWVPASLLAADDEVAVLLFADSNQEDGVILGPFGDAAPAHFDQPETAAPATPASGFLRWFASAAQGWGYFINDAGAEVPAGLAVLNLPVITGHRPGTAVIATVATNPYALGLPNAATPTAVGSLKLPPGWAGRMLTVNIHWAPSTTNGGNCVFFAEAYVIQDAATVSAAASWIT